MRAALYWAPAIDDPLHNAGSAWLGRDAETNAPVEQPPLPGIVEMTADPRLYGLHATLKPPFHLTGSYARFIADAAALASRIAAFELPPLAVRNYKNFLALRETSPCPQLQFLADEMVRGLDRHRAAPDAAELARRRPASLSPTQLCLLERWGYPYVMEEWSFHVTLTRRLTDAELSRVLPAAEAHLSDIAARPRRIEAVCVFTQASPGAPFLVAERLSLRA
jgi:hypothetical protein